MIYPQTRLRRLRYNKNIRNLTSEISLRVDDFIYPLFVCEGNSISKEIKSLPGQFQLSIDQLILKIEEAKKVGIHSFILFPISESKDTCGDVGISDNNILQKAIRKIKNCIDDILIVADVCNCAYTSHGHCGTIVDGDVDNDITIKNLALQSVSLAKSGADIIAPSDMMDGRVKIIREYLDKNGFEKVPIMSYSAKFASNFYGPFREASNSSPKSGSRSTYQLSFSNAREAMREGQLDVEEGADMLMVKPALSYLDIIYQFKLNYKLPIVAFNVSGEYFLVKSQEKNTQFNNIELAIEVLTSIKRAGADIIISYHALEIAKYIKENNEIR
tara:strand:+ start:29046 stop:30035 length:990 start_codon:yes stop_codon:yes gene_type:complete